MKRIGIAILIALAFVFAVFEVGAQSRAVFKTVTGKVEIQNPGEQAWGPASVGMEVPIKATISTGFGGGAVLEVGASTLTVRQLTRLRIDDLSTQNKVTKTNLTMRVGRIRAEVKSTAGTATDFKLRSPVSTAAVRGTGFETEQFGATIHDRQYARSGGGVHQAARLGKPQVDELADLLGVLVGEVVQRAALFEVVEQDILQRGGNEEVFLTQT